MRWSSPAADDVHGVGVGVGLRQDLRTGRIQIRLHALPATVCAAALVLGFRV